MFPKIKLIKIPKRKFLKIPLGISKIRKNIHFRKLYFRNQKILGKLKIRTICLKKLLGKFLGKIDKEFIFFRKNGREHFFDNFQAADPESFSFVTKIVNISLKTFKFRLSRQVFSTQLQNISLKILTIQST